MGKPGVLQSVGLQRIGHDLGTEQQLYIGILGFLHDLVYFILCSETVLLRRDPEALPDCSNNGSLNCFFSVPVIVSSGYCNKSSQLGWLQTTEIYSLIAQRQIQHQSQGQKSRSPGAVLPTEALEENLCLLPLLVAASTPLLVAPHSHLCLRLHMALSSSVCDLPLPPS